MGPVTLLSPPDLPSRHLQLRPRVHGRDGAQLGVLVPGPLLRERQRHGGGRGLPGLLLRPALRRLVPVTRPAELPLQVLTSPPPELKSRERRHSGGGEPRGPRRERDGPWGERKRERIVCDEDVFIF